MRARHVSPFNIPNHPQRGALIGSRRKMTGFIEKTLNQRRSLEQALADLVAKQQREPRPELARMVEQLRAEIEFRKRRRPDKPS
jgi:hypothetical protein